MAYVTSNDLFFSVISFAFDRNPQNTSFLSYMHSTSKNLFVNKVLKEMHQNEKTSIMNFKVVVGSFM